MSRAVAFPDGFLWGAATSAFQIEGGADLDGRGPSIWDTFCATPGRVRNGDDARVAIDHRNRIGSDVALMAELGLPAYRFSISWPRVQPLGHGPVSQAGIDVYRSLVEELLAAGIEPIVTLYHWDLPQALEDLGGWPARDTAARFADYAFTMGEALGQQVRRWGTINEPWCASMLGYAAGVHAPGRVAPGAAVAAAHHLLLGHGLAVDALRASVRADAEVSITLNPYPVVAAGRTDADRDAVRRVDGVANRLWYDALLLGRYPDDVLGDFEAVSDLSHMRQGDLAVISRPIDALGLNYYRRHHVRARKGASVGHGEGQWPGSPDIELVDPPGRHTDGGWAIEPEGLTEALVRLHQDHDPPPLYLHEVGAAFDDELGPHGQIDDRRRIAWLEAHVEAAAEAIAEGVDLRGLMVWSLFDNFEWAEGYAHRFGIVHVDRTSMVRTPKASAHWLSGVIRANGLPPAGD
ncbi:MAG TPA: GH1 family beta-glucosidase [Acidimicrobiales bacterium]|nr:GH1 family beta-glucosidase [Acidimicrobiales bacterium]